MKKRAPRAKREESKASVFFQEGPIQILHSNFLEAPIEVSSIDLIVTSPPYNVDIAYGQHLDHMGYESYLEFSRAWMARCFELAREDGRFCLNIPLDKNKGGQQSVCSDLTALAKSVGWKYQCTIIWNEQNISRRTAWGSWLSASAPFVIAPVEVIVVLYKNVWKKIEKGNSDINREEFMKWTNGVWDFKGESKKRIGHPAPFPVELPRRCIKLYSFVGQRVLDPFLGSGSTLLACSETGRQGIGVELDLRYCRLSRARLLKHSVLHSIR